MSDSLRDQLMGLGFKPAPKPERKPDARKPGQKPHGKGAAPPRPGHAGKPRPPQGPSRKPRSQEDIDLAKAYAIRAQREKDERIEAERVKQEE
ncbi:MAG TPA: DUF2058 domain-containing protein, partial [Pseudoxanthomonas sp.]